MSRLPRFTNSQCSSVAFAKRPVMIVPLNQHAASTRPNRSYARSTTAAHPSRVAKSVGGTTSVAAPAAPASCSTCDMGISWPPSGACSTRSWVGASRVTNDGPTYDVTLVMRATGRLIAARDQRWPSRRRFLNLDLM